MTDRLCQIDGPRIIDLWTVKRIWVQQFDPDWHPNIFVVIDCGRHGTAVLLRPAEMTVDGCPPVRHSCS